MRTATAVAAALCLVGGPQRPGAMHSAEVGAVVAAAGSMAAGPAHRASAAPSRAAARTPWQAELIDLFGPARVREAFNADVGRARVLLTFSPT